MADLTHRVVFVLATDTAEVAHFSANTAIPVPDAGVPITLSGPRSFTVQGIAGVTYEQGPSGVEVVTTVDVVPAGAMPGKQADQVSRTDQLRDRIRAEGGRWDQKRALATYEALGFHCNLPRARRNLRHVAETNPGLLVPVDGLRWTFDVEEG
jgi:hypothetical protein